MPSKLLAQELIDLERNGNTGKIDHPDGGKTGSKDLSDAVCGALWNASQHAEEYAFEYGEDLTTIQEANVLNEDGPANKKQILVDMEEELKNFISSVKKNQPQGKGLDFGMGQAIPWGGNTYAQDGILIW